MIAHNVHFVVMPGIGNPDLIDSIFKAITTRVSIDWQKVYNHPLLWLEACADYAWPYKETQFAAAGWECIGETSGRARKGPRKEITKSRLQVFFYPIAEESLKYLNNLVGRRLENDEGGFDQ
ncbi:MAG: hypothetical protein CSYNP_03986 [Syntrophus sp. SKADARSKE-3]|nr:hypothetical protein [Syntrophus sp. SKADARSKE-3]